MNSTLDIPALPETRIVVHGNAEETDEACAILNETQLSDLQVCAGF